MALLSAAIVTHKSDWHTREFEASHHFLLSIYAQLMRVESANALLEELNDVDTPPTNLRQLISFDFIDEQTDQPVQLGQSSFSRANAHRSYLLWRTCFEGLWQIALRHMPPHKFEGLGQVLAVDGSLFDCLGRMAWATYKTNCPKARGHFCFDLHGLPTKLVLTTGKGSEREVLRQHLQANATYIMDRGYNDYSLFAKVREAQAHFVTRLLVNASYTQVASYRVPADLAKLGVVSDNAIYFNSDSHKQLWRVVTFRDIITGKEWSYLTDRTDLAAMTIVHLYCYRWEVENFFAWIKSHLQVRHWWSLQ
jgi:hypothetical protein